MTDTAQIETRLLAALADIRTNWAALIAPTSGGSGGAPTNDDVTALDRRVSLRHEVTLCLNGWARVIVEDFHLTHRLPLGTDTLGLIELIERWARLFSGHKAGETAADEIETKAAEVVKAAAPERRDWVYLGDCPRPVEDWTCAGQVKAWPDEPSRLPSCAECGHEDGIDWWLEAMGLPATVSHDGLRDFIRQQTGRTISPVTLWRWLRAGWIEPCGVDAEGRPVYDKGGVGYALSKHGVA